jgi:TATA-box binding protein (TBP) (component of TFIID and TFIIIB)
MQGSVETDFHSPKIVNVVGTFQLDKKEDLKLDDIASRWNGSRYNKNRFSGLITYNHEPKATFMIFFNGKVNVTGAKSATDC